MCVASTLGFSHTLCLDESDAQPFVCHRRNSSNMQMHIIVGGPEVLICKIGPFKRA